MHFFKKAVTCALALLAVPSLAALTAVQMTGNIKVVTDKSMALQKPANSITLLNAPLIIIGQGPFPQIIAGFTDIISTVTVAIVQMRGSNKITDTADAKMITDAFRTFVMVHQQLLNILIGKAGLLNTVPIVGAPVASVLRELEKVVDAIAFSLIDLVDVAASRDQLDSDAINLKGSIQLASSTYDGLKLKKRHARDFSN